MTATKPAKKPTRKKVSARIANRATNVDDYLAQLDDDRRAVILAARKFVRANLPKGYAEFMNWGVINWGIPLEEFSNTYNGQPLCYVALGAQKNYNVLYVLGCYSESRHRYLRDEFKKAGKRFDMGKSCLRFQSLDDLELKSVAKVIGMDSPRKFLAYYKSVKGLTANRV